MELCKGLLGIAVSAIECPQGGIPVLARCCPTLLKLKRSFVDTGGKYATGVNTGG